MSSLALRSAFDRSRMRAVADVVAILLAISLPWSTSATGILAAVYLLVALPVLRADNLATLRAMPAAWLPIALVGLGLLGMLWADVSLHERIGGLNPFAKLLVVPLLMLHFQQSERGRAVLLAFIGSCTVLLAASLVPVVVPPLRWMWGEVSGVPVKDYISQSGEFLICAFAALYLAVDFFKAGRRLAALVALVLAALFVVDILYVRSGRTAFVTLPVLLILFGIWLFGWKGLIGALLIGTVVGALAWVSSPYLRERTMSVFVEIHLYQTENAVRSSGERLEFWKKSMRFIVEAPVIGHGTGSIASLFRGAVVGASGASAEATTNPHNQTFAVGIQLGVAGILLLWAMWIAHILLFRAHDFTAWVGLVVVANSIVGSLFNSHLFDFTQGWIYVVLVGAAGGATLRASSPVGIVSGR